MRIYKLNTSLKALLLAHIAFAVSFGLGFFILANSVAGQVLTLFYAPTEYFQNICLPSTYFKKGMGPIDVGMSDRFLECFCFYFFGLVQWYLLFLVGIGIYRHLSKMSNQRPKTPAT